MTFGEPAGSYAICPVCFWEDDNVQLRWPDWAGGANKLSLIDAQRNYAEFGAMERRFRGNVRAAVPDEHGEEGWRSIDPTLDSFEPRAVQETPWPDDLPSCTGGDRPSGAVRLPSRRCRTRSVPMTMSLVRHRHDGAVPGKSGSHRSRSGWRAEREDYFVEVVPWMPIPDADQAFRTWLESFGLLQYGLPPKDVAVDSEQGESGELRRYRVFRDAIPTTP